MADNRKPKSKTTITRTGKIFLFIIMFTMGISYALSVSLMFLIGALFLGIFILNVLHVRSNLKGLYAEVVEESEYFAEQTGHISIRVENKKRWSTSNHIEVSILSGMKSKSDFLFEAIKPAMNQKVRLAISPQERGYHTLNQVRLESGYPFGLANRRLDFELNKKVLVYPKLLSRLPEHLRGETAEHGGIPFNSGDYQYLASYQPGDDVRLIHWRKSSLLENPVLKRDLVQTEVADPRLFIPDACPQFEYAISAMATHIFEQDWQPWQVYASNGVRQMQSQQEMLEFLAQVQPLSQVANLEETGQRVLYASQLLPE